MVGRQKIVRFLEISAIRINAKKEKKTRAMTTF